MTTQKTAEIKPPAHFDRKSKAEFRRLLATVSGSQEQVSAEDLADFVTCRQRIRWLEEQFARDFFPKDKRATARELAGAVSLSHRLADRIGLGKERS